MTNQELVAAALQAARAARDECPMIGWDNASEWPLRGRLAIHLARQKTFLELEKRNIHVDIEYGQQSVHELKKITQDWRIDLLVHKRGSQTSNLLAVELKVSDARAEKVNAEDEEKLIELTTNCDFKTGLWIRLPKTAQGHRGRYAIFRRGEEVSLRDL